MFQPVLSDPSVYRPASGPAYADATNVGELGASTAMAEPRFDPIPYPEHSGEVPEDQRRIEEAVLAGANAYKPDVSESLKELLPCALLISNLL